MTKRDILALRHFVIKVVFLFMITTVVFNYVPKSQRLKKESYLSKFEQVDIAVLPGDTAWSIQQRLTPNEDVRKVLYHSANLNGGRSMGSVEAYEVLTFLKER